MTLKHMEKQLKIGNELMKEMIKVTDRTRKTLTMVNLVNVITLIVIALFMIKGGL